MAMVAVTEAPHGSLLMVAIAPAGRALSPEGGAARFAAMECAPAAVVVADPTLTLQVSPA